MQGYDSAINKWWVQDVWRMQQRHISTLVAVAFPQCARFLPQQRIAQKRCRISEPENVSIQPAHGLLLWLGHNRGELQAVGAFARILGQFWKTSTASLRANFLASQDSDWRRPPGKDFRKLTCLPTAIGDHGELWQ